MADANTSAPATQTLPALCPPTPPAPLRGVMVHVRMRSTVKLRTRTCSTVHLKLPPPPTSCFPSTGREAPKSAMRPRGDDRKSARVAPGSVNSITVWSLATSAPCRPGFATRDSKDFQGERARFRLTREPSRSRRFRNPKSLRFVLNGFSRVLDVGLCTGRWSLFFLLRDRSIVWNVAVGKSSLPSFSRSLSLILSHSASRHSSSFIASDPLWE